MIDDTVWINVEDDLYLRANRIESVVQAPRRAVSIGTIPQTEITMMSGVRHYAFSTSPQEVIALMKKASRQ